MEDGEVVEGTEGDSTSEADDTNRQDPPYRRPLSAIGAFSGLVGRVGAPEEKRLRGADGSAAGGEQGKEEELSRRRHLPSAFLFRAFNEIGRAHV